MSDLDKSAGKSAGGRDESTALALNMVARPHDYMPPPLAPGPGENSASLCRLRRPSEKTRSPRTSEPNCGFQ
jgi:hypothetical protein